MKKKFRNFVFLMIASGSIAAQMPMIPPSMLAQFQNLSIEEQRRLAEQYGINMDSMGVNQGINSGSQLGEQADPISSNPDQVLYKRLMQGKTNQQKLEEIEKELIPIFERRHDDIDDIPIFGRSLFDNEVSTYASVDNAPVPDSYRIGVGDTVNIMLYGSENLERELKVDRSGEINLPKIGNINIAGMTFGQMSNYIKDRVSRELIGVNISVSIGSLRSINVFVAGEARVSGAYSVSALSTVSQILFVAGGVSDIGSLRNIEVKNNGKTKARFDVYKLLTEGDTQGDVRLQSGDVVFVPPIQKTVIIDGAVRRQGRYELKQNETLEDLINLAGGLDNRAFLDKVFIERFTSDSDLPNILNLDISNELNRDFKVEDGDIIRIAHVSNQLNNSVLTKGALQRPGKYGWTDGIKVTDIIRNIDVDLLEDVDTKQSLIVRRKNNNTRDIYTLSFDLGEAINNPNSPQNMVLQPYDEIIVFSMENDERYSAISLLEFEETIKNKLDNSNEDLVQESQSDTSSNPLVMPDQTLDKIMSDDEYKLLANEKKMEINNERQKRGNRLSLLEPIIKKLYRQADAEEPVQVIFISGGVKAPGEYPLSENITIDGLISLAGGYTDDAVIDQAELRRIEVDENGIIDTLLIDINLLDDNSDTGLSSRDHLRINKIKNWDINDSIEIKGEVVYPGDYLISPNETLSSVIRRAGGLTNESFINGAVFTRESIKEKEREQLLILSNNIRRDQASRSMTKESQDFSISSKEIEESIDALLSTEVIGRLIIDLPRVINGDPSADLVLQDGDTLEIPKYNNAVTIVGEVRRSGSFVRQKSFKVDDYIELAAGMTERANRKQIYVIRADGSVDKLDGKRRTDLLNFTNESEIMAGDTIVVPIKASYQSPLNLYSTVSQVIFQSIASLAAITTVVN